MFLWTCPNCGHTNEEPNDAGELLCCVECEQDVVIVGGIEGDYSAWADVEPKCAYCDKPGTRHEYDNEHDPIGWWCDACHDDAMTEFGWQSVNSEEVPF